MLELSMFYETISDNPRNYFIVLSFVIYTIIKKHVYIDYLAFRSKTFSEITVGSKGGSKH